MSSEDGEIITCLAAVAWKADSPLSVEKIQVLPPRHGEVRIKIVATGICFTDISASRGKILDVKFPIILGHEATGIVESVGEGVKSLKAGDRVVTLFLPQCKNCRTCRSESSNTCLEFFGSQSKGLMGDDTTRFLCRGQPIYHFLGCSTFSEYTVLKECNLSKINSDAPMENICLFSCGFTTGYGAAVKTAKVKANSVCAVWGIGSIGLAAVLGCKKAGASRIIGIDTNPSKFDLAREMGCTDCVNPKEIEMPLENYLTEKFGAINYTFECVGSIETMRQAFVSCAVGDGVCVLIGVSPQEQQLSIFPIDLLMGRTLTGELFGSYRGVDELPALIEECVEQKLPLEKFISHKMSLEKINDGMELMKNGKCMRCIIINES